MNNIDETLIAYQEKMHAILDDLSSSYINYKLHPEYNENQSIYANTKGNVESLEASVFTLTNSFQKQIDQLNQHGSALNRALQEEKVKNQELERLLSQTLTSTDGSELLMNESSDLYKMQRITNIGMIIGILGGAAIMMKVYSVKQ